MPQYKDRKMTRGYSNFYTESGILGYKKIE